MTDKEFRNYIDTSYFELKDNHERYGIEELYNSDIKEDERRKCVVLNNEEGEVSDFGEYFFEEYLKNEPQKPMNLQDITKRSIIKNIKRIDKKMRLLEQRVYDNIREFYLSVES